MELLLEDFLSDDILGEIKRYSKKHYYAIFWKDFLDRSLWRDESPTFSSKPHNWNPREMIWELKSLHMPGKATSFVCRPRPGPLGLEIIVNEGGHILTFNNQHEQRAKDAILCTWNDQFYGLVCSDRQMKLSIFKSNSWSLVAEYPSPLMEGQLKYRLVVAKYLYIIVEAWRPHKKYQVDVIQEVAVYKFDQTIQVKFRQHTTQLISDGHYLYLSDSEDKQVTKYNPDKESFETIWDDPHSCLNVFEGRLYVHCYTPISKDYLRINEKWVQVPSPNLPFGDSQWL